MPKRPDDAGEESPDLLRAKEELAAANAWQRTILDSANVSIIATDPEGLIVTFNAAAERMLGYRAEEVVGKTTPGVIHDPEEVKRRAAELSRELGRVIEPGFEVFVAKARSGVPEEREWTYIRKDGSRLPVWLSVTAMFEAAGSITGFMGLATDLTERKREEERFRWAVEATPNGIVAVDEAGVITLVNSQAEALFGYAREQLIGQPVEALVPERFRASHPAHRRSFFADPKTRAMGAGRDLFGLRKDGREVPIEIGLNPIVTSEGPAVLASIIDITERRQAEAALREAHDELERRVRERTAELTATNESLQAEILQRKRAEALLKGDQEVMGMIAAGRPLSDILDTLARTIEAQTSGALCSILLLDPDGAHLRHGAAPSLPEAYNRAIDGGAIGPRVGSCGTAAYLRKQVIVADIAIDPLWAGFSELALRHELRACWSTPILSADGRVLGTFAVYSRQPRTPGPEDFAAIDRAIHLASIAIERKQAEEAVRDRDLRMRLATEATEVGIWEWNVITNKIRWDAQMFRIHGIAPTKDGSVEYSDWAGCVLPEELSRQEELLQDTVRRLARSIREFHIRRRDDSECRLIQAVETVRANAQGQAEWVVGTNLDVTEHRQAQEALLRAKEDLEIKVVERTAELQAATERAQAADRAKSTFLATMSHELRTPLNSIIGFTGVILQGLAGPLNAEQTKQLEMVRGSARHLLSLINDVLDISKIEAGQLEVASEPFDLAASIAKVAGIVTPLAEKKGLSLGVQVAPGVGQIVSDPRRVEQILLNLLNNAIKFTERGEVALAVKLVPDWSAPGAASTQQAVRLRVSDTGIGIKPEDMVSLFEAFRQIDSTLSRMNEGTGLGLAICRRLADLLGGEIRVESVWQQGSTFTLTLPVKGAARS